MSSNTFNSGTQRFLPVIAITLFFASESFIKSGFPYIFISLIGFLLSATYLFFYLRQNSNEFQWESLKFSLPSWSIFFVFLLAALLRFWKLGTLFEGLGWDEAYKGLDAIAIRDFGDRPVFLNWNAGRDALIAYLVAFAQIFFGYSAVSVRIVNAIAGTLTVVFLYFFVKELFGPKMAWVSAFLLAVSKWHIIHSRYAVRAALFPLFELAVLYLTVRALRSDKPRLLIVAGLIAGVGFYSYTAYRIFPLILLCLLLEKNLRLQAAKYWKHVLAGVGVCVLILMPFVVYTLQNPKGVFDRMGRTLVWDEGSDNHAVSQIQDSVTSTLGMFTFRGDTIIKHNIPGEPMLSPFLCGAFLLGFIVLLARVKPVAIFLLAYLFFSLLPGFLTLQAPQASRTLGAAPPAIIIAAIGLLSAGSVILHLGQLPFRIFMIGILSANLLIGPRDALIRYGEILDSISAMDSSNSGLDKHQYQVADLVSRIGEGCEIYLSPQLYYHSTIAYLNYNKSKYRLFSQYTKFEPVSGNGKVAIVALVLDDTNLWWLRDEEGKNFFKWWTQVSGVEPENIRALIQRTYISHPRMMSTSDNRLLYMLQTRYPTGRLIDFGQFSVFLLGPVKSQSGL